MTSGATTIGECGRGEAPLPGALGCPSDIFSSPLLARASPGLDEGKGAMAMGERGIVKLVFQHPATMAFVEDGALPWPRQLDMGNSG